MDAHTFLFGLQTAGHTNNWMPWTQGEYIRNVLKGGEGHRSASDRGVCNGISTYVVKRWLEGGHASWDIINELEKSSVAEFVSDTQGNGSAGAGVVPEALRQGGFQRRFFTRITLNGNDLLSFTNIGPAYVSLARPGHEMTGHAIAVHGHEKSVFDPNIGFAQGVTLGAYKAIIRAIVDRFYDGSYTNAEIVEFGA